MNEPVHENKGFIDKFIGDAVMALFDSPTGTNTDKAQDAIRAALDLRYAINLYIQRRANSNYPPINIGIVINLGPVIIGTVNSNVRMDTTVLGDSVNIALDSRPWPQNTIRTWSLVHKLYIKQEPKVYLNIAC
jgi:adenylate cyclase